MADIPSPAEIRQLERASIDGLLQIDSYNDKRAKVEQFLVNQDVNTGGNKRIALDASHIAPQSEDYNWLNDSTNGDYKSKYVRTEIVHTPYQHDGQDLYKVRLTQIDRPENVRIFNAVAPSDVLKTANPTLKLVNLEAKK